MTHLSCRFSCPSPVTSKIKTVGGPHYGRYNLLVLQFDLFEERVLVSQLRWRLFQKVMFFNTKESVSFIDLSERVHTCGSKKILSQSVRSRRIEKMNCLLSNINLLEHSRNSKINVCFCEFWSVSLNKK